MGFSEISTSILAIASAIVLLSNAGAAIARAVKTAKAPNATQNDRLDELERWRKVVDKKLERDHDSNRVSLQALIALLDHGLYGNNIDQMEAAKNELKKYLTER